MKKITSFHPAVGRWFSRHFAAPTEPQARAWPEIQARRNVLIAAPTGSGKTLAAFLAAIDSLVRRGVEEPLPDETLVVYVSPLKALSNDIQKNLAVPIAGIPAEFRGWVFWEIMLFIAILAAAFAYAWRKGVFEWR